MPPPQSKLARIAAAALKKAPADDDAAEPVLEIPGKTFAPHSNKKPSMPIIAKRDWAWNVDSFFYQLPKEVKKRAIFCAVEMTSRKVFALPYLNTEGDTAAARTANAKRAVANLTALRAKYRINLIQADKGTEFRNKLVEAWAENQEPPIEMYFTQTGVKNEAAMVESFNANLRQLLDLYSAEKSKRKSGYEDFASFISSAVEDYNNTKSKVLHVSPSSVDESQMGYIRLVLSERGGDYLKKLNAIEPGDTVRIWDAVDPRLSGPELTNYNFSHKGRHRFMEHLFEVVDLSGYKVIVKDAGADDSEAYDRRISPRDIQVIPRSYEAPESDGEDNVRIGDFKKKRYENVEDVEAKEAAVERKVQAVKNKAGLGEKDKPWNEYVEEPPKGKRAPKASAAKLASEEQQRSNRRSLSITARQPGAVKITGHDVDPEKQEAIFYVTYGRSKTQFAVNAQDFYKDGVWEPEAEKYFKSKAAQEYDAQETIEKYIK